MKIEGDDPEESGSGESEKEEEDSAFGGESIKASMIKASMD